MAELEYFEIGVKKLHFEKKILNFMNLIFGIFGKILILKHFMRRTIPKRCVLEVFWTAQYVSEVYFTWRRHLLTLSTSFYTYNAFEYIYILLTLKNKETRLSVSGHGRLTWIRFQLLPSFVSKLKLQWKMRFRKGGRYRRGEVEALPTTPIILCVVVSVSVSYVTQLFEVDTDFKNVFTLKKISIHQLSYILGIWSRMVFLSISAKNQETFILTWILFFHFPVKLVLPTYGPFSWSASLSQIFS